MESLPEDVLLNVLEFLDVYSLGRLSCVCQQLRDVCQLRVVWLRAYTCSTLPLPPIPSDQHEDFDHRLHLVRATQLYTNWTSSHPSPKSRRSYSTHIAAIWLFRSRFLVTFTYNDVVCWDLDNDLETPLWKMPCPLRPIKYEAAEMLVEGSRGIVFAYTTFPTTNCFAIYAPCAEGADLSPRFLPDIISPVPVHAVGLGEEDIIMASADRSLALQNLTTGARRSIIMMEDIIATSIDSLAWFQDIVLAVRRKNRSIAIDVYDISDAATPLSTADDPTPGPPHRRKVRPATIQIAQAQTVVLSKVQNPSATPDDGPPGMSHYSFHVLAALPYSLDNYRLEIRRSVGSQPDLDMVLLGNDHGSRKSHTAPGAAIPPPPRFQETASEDSDEYDSDSTLNRIAQPSQVLDLQIGPRGSRAVAIQVAAHTNDRTIWGYSANLDGSMVAKRLSFTLSAPKAFETISQETPLDRSAEDDARQMVKEHACRAVFDEVTGRVVVALDCQVLLAFQY